MPIDTQAKRNSAIASRRLPWLRRFAPVADGTVSQEDRQQSGLVYNGILSGTSILPGAVRNSAIATRRLPWFRRFPPLSDGSMTQEDRQQTAFVYRDILAQSVPPAPTPDDEQIMPRPGPVNFPAGAGGRQRPPVPLEAEDFRGERTGVSGFAISGQSQVSLAIGQLGKGLAQLSGKAKVNSAVHHQRASRFLVQGRSAATGIDWIRVQMEDYMLMGIS